MLKTKTKSSASAQFEFESEALLKSFASASNGINARVKIKQQKKYGRIRVMLLVLVVFLTIVYLSFVTESFDRPKISVNVPSDDGLDYKSNNETTTSIKGPDRYLTHGPECKIPDIDPFGKDVMTLFYKENHRECSTQPPITFVHHIWINDTVMLHVNISAVQSYLIIQNDSIECCYQEVLRLGEFAEADQTIYLTSCRSFDRVAQLSAEAEFILVKCKSMSTGEEVYTNGHALVRRKADVTARFKKMDQNGTDNRTKPLSVLLIGIDSVSRLNFIRSMPNTVQYLKDTGWVELQGYNKIDDNTFPNLMAILTGLNETMTVRVCNPKELGKLDDCPMIWHTFREQGYTTAYAEDEVSINTFNYLKAGFVSQPVDHYFRPFGIAAEKLLNKTELSGLHFCLGYQTYADHIYQYALDFATQYKGNPYFGLFWTSSFSHNDFSSASRMDDNMKKLITQMGELGILNETLVIFLSDHGIRYGDIRKLFTGWYEERLPFIYFSLPKWFKQEHPEFVRNLEINRNRLTTPYDFHVTLKHILSLSGTNVSLEAPSCPLCQSLFEEIPYDRSCADASIIEHWCTCIPYEKFDNSSSEVRKAVDFVIQKINNDLQAFKIINAVSSSNSTTSTTIYTNNCAKLELKNILNAYTTKNSSNNVTYYLVSFVASPGEGEFEATVKYNRKSGYQVSGLISRLNLYGIQGECIKDSTMQSYCYCMD